jgi:microsomal epoxide hydrolase/non-specific protein-tyrosine kinase
VELSVHAAGPADGPVVVLLHGWPELAYSWKHQIGPIAEAGFRVLAPDGRGFGGSDAPDSVAAYGIDHLVSDVEGLLDWAGAEKAVVVGHDWGGIVAWHFAMLRPERTRGVVGVNTPHLPHGARKTTESMRDYGGEDHYIVQVQEPGRAEAAFSRNFEDFFAFMFAGPPPAEDLDKLPRSITHLLKRFARYDRSKARDIVVPEEDRQVFIDAYAKTGLTGGLNWYRNMDANWARMDGVDHNIDKPALMISAQCDPILPPRLTRWMDDLTRDLERHVIPDIGHWTQWEAPDQLNALLIDWLERRMKD